MKSLSTKTLAILSCLLLAGTSTSFAQVDAGTQDAINAMRDQIRILENKITQIERGKPGIQHEGHAFPATERGGGLAWLGEDIVMGGHLDIQFNQNIRYQSPDVTGTTPGGVPTNAGRVFDNNRDSFVVNAATLNFSKAAEPEGGFGFFIEVNMGQDATVVAADGGTEGSTFDLQQAYVEYVQPLRMFEGNEILPQSVKLTAGRFVTLAGAEVIEGYNNWNISRSFAFGNTIPFTHTGVRSEFSLFQDLVDVYIGLNNGWDLAVDNNEAKTLELGLGYHLMENLSVFHSFYWSPGGDRASRKFGGPGHVLWSNVLTYDVSEDLSLMFEANIGQQRRALAVDGPTTATTATGENVQWYSWNFYGRYQLTEQDAFAYRFELLNDQQMFRTGLDRTLWAHTFTLERQLRDNVILRGEYRYDHGNNHASLGGSHGQSTLAAQLLYII